MEMHQFHNMLELDDVVFSVDLPYHSKLSWLSQVLAKILSLREQIIKFYEEQNQQCERFLYKCCISV